MVGNNRVGNNENGAAAVEFALILPLLLLILFGIVEFGRVYSQYQVFQGAAREGGRYAAVRNGTGLGPDSTAVRAKVVAAAEPYQDKLTGVTIAVSKQCSSSNIGTTVTVSWSQPETIDIPLMPAINLNLPIKSAFRCE